MNWLSLWWTLPEKASIRERNLSVCFSIVRNRTVRLE